MASWIVLHDFRTDGTLLKSGTEITDQTHDVAALVRAGLTVSPKVGDIMDAVQMYRNQADRGGASGDLQGDMIANALRSTAGASMIKTLSGQSVESAISVAGVPSIPSFVFSPGNPDPGPDEFTTWAAMHAAYEATSGPSAIYCSNQYSAVTIPAGTWPIRRGTIFSGDKTFPTPVALADGCELPGLNRIQFMALESLSSSPAVVLDAAQAAIDPLFLLDGGSTLTSNGSGPLVLVTNDAPGTQTIFGVQRGSGILRGTSPTVVFESTGNTVVSVLTVFDFGQVQAGAFGTAGAGEDVFVQVIVGPLVQDVSFDQPDYDAASGPFGTGSLSGLKNQTAFSAIKTSNYVVGSDGEGPTAMVRCDTTGGTFDVEAPAPCAHLPRGFIFGVKIEAGAAAVGTVVASGSGDTIEVASIVNVGSLIWFANDGVSNWFVTNRWDAP